MPPTIEQRRAATQRAREFLEGFADPDAALPDLRRLIAEDDDDPRYYDAIFHDANLGFWLNKLVGQDANTLEFFGGLSAIHSNFNTAFKYAHIYLSYSRNLYQLAQLVLNRLPPVDSLRALEHARIWKRLEAPQFVAESLNFAQEHTNDPQLLFKCAEASIDIGDAGRAEACLGKAEQFAATVEDWTNCARAWRRMNRFEDKTRCDHEVACLQLTRDSERAGDLTSILNVARRFIALPGGLNQARNCMARAETHVHGPADFLACAEAWMAFPDEEQARRCLIHAEENIQEQRGVADQRIENWLACATKWTDLLQDREKAGACVNSAEALIGHNDPANKVANWIHCARLWRELNLEDGYDQARRCIKHAEEMAVEQNTLEAWLACGQAWAVVHDLRATRRCFYRAERLASGYSDWRDCYRAWSAVDYATADVDRCLQRAIDELDGDNGCEDGQRDKRMEIVLGFNTPPERVYNPPVPGANVGAIQGENQGARINQPDEDPADLEDPEEFMARLWRNSPPIDHPKDVRQTDFDDAITVLLKRLPSRGCGLAVGKTREERVRFQTDKNGVFFYPAGGIDWEPIHRFSGVCNTFIYCDHGEIDLNSENFSDYLARKHCRAHIRDLITIEGVQPLPHPIIDHLGYEQGPPPANHSCGIRAFISCHTSDQPRLMQLWYLPIEGALLYKNLFKKRNWAPEYLCIKQNAAGFQSWQSPLARHVFESQAIPRFMVVGDMNHGYDWPWNVQWLRFPVWHQEAAGSVRVLHRHEIAPTRLEMQDFCLTGIPQNEWPEA